jgi:hypothetical protein
MKIPDLNNAAGCDLSCASKLSAHIKQNFAVVNIVYDDFEVEVHTIFPSVTVSALFGGIGGNLGLFVGKVFVTCLARIARVRRVQLEFTREKGCTRCSTKFRFGQVLQS